MQNNLNKHRPFHIYDGYCYAIATRTYEKKNYFATDERKRIFIKKMNSLGKNFDIGIIAWTLLPNHHHAIIRLPEQKFKEGRPVLSEYMRQLHSQTASLLNQIDNTPGRKVWYQYWDYCIRTKTAFWMHFNYIVQNPLKHGLVPSLYEAYDYKFSSNPIWLERFGMDGLWESFVRYQVTDWTPDECG